MDEVVVEKRDGVSIVRINRPHRANAMDAATAEGIGNGFLDAAADPAVRVVILTGTGEKVFCAGMDLKAFAEARAAGVDAVDEGPGKGHRAIEVFTRRHYPKPVIAAINGAAMGGGFELMLACDLVVAAEHARFGLPEANRGLVAGGGGTAISKRIPIAVALEMALTGEPISAARALELGLVNRVVAGDRVIDTAIELAAAMARSGPLALDATKRLLWEAMGEPDWPRITEIIGPVFASQDAIEGATAFAERRPPNWRGV